MDVEPVANPKELFSEYHFWALHDQDRKSLELKKETSFSIYNAIYSENKKGKNSASVTLPLGDALQTFHVILTSPHSAVSVTLIFLSKLVYNEGF